MRATYRVLGFLIALLVVVQAAMIAWAVAGLGRWITEEGGVADAAFLDRGEDAEMAFTEEWGFAIHAFFNGMVAIPLAALLMLIVSFFVKVKGTTWLALAVVVLVAIQIALGTFSASEGIPVLGLLHGLNALILFMAALHAARRAKQPAEGAAPEATPEPAAV